MAKKKHTLEQIINKLREAEVLLAKGMKVPAVCRKLSITEQTYYRWRKEFGGLKTDQVKKMKDLIKENSRLKKMVAEQALDIAMLKEISEGNF